MLKKFILILVLFFSFFGGINNSFAAKEDYKDGNINVQGLEKDKNKAYQVNDHFQDIRSDSDNNASLLGREAIDRTFGNVAKSMKNIFYILAGLYFLVLVLQLFFSSNTEEEVTKFKKGIIWISIGIMVMQIASSFVAIVFDRGFDAALASNLSDTIIRPFIELIRFMASFLFVAIAIYSFYTLVTANGDEERIKRGRYSIFQAIIGFFVLKITEVLVENSYGKILCGLGGGGSMGDSATGNACIGMPKFEGNGELIIKIINWVNGFVAILTVLFIIWAGVIILFSNGDEEKMKKAKGIIIYVIIGIFILAFSYLILNFLPEAQRLGFPI